ncbi:MAG: hypothetical protein JW982_13140 [Spirochaetes bacterium]|nr:hypothetical protein [Spirochaetota bacterium]
MEWEKVLRNSVKDGVIAELHLKKIPVLKNCENWKMVEPIGYVDHQMKFSHYKGLLVLHQDRIYFVSSSTINALSEFIKWDIKKRITVN